MTDKPYRSIIKAISWRMTGTIDTIIVSCIIGFVELFTKIGLYYLHERVWNRLKIGRIAADGAKEDYQI